MPGGNKMVTHTYHQVLKGKALRKNLIIDIWQGPKRW